MMKDLSLYIHFPFCTYKCPYCDFYNILHTNNVVDLFLEGLNKEISLVAEKFDLHGSVISTLYIGGGTPSLLEGKRLEVLLNLFETDFRLDHDLEFTMEVNPESVSKQRLSDWRELGVNRISIGCQSFSDRGLKILGRRHTVLDSKRAVNDALASGFENVNVDLIFAYPGSGLKNWKDDLRTAISFDPQHISLYGLKIEEKTRFFDWISSGKFILPSEEEYADQYLLACEMLNRAGYEHYEVSNFCRPGCESKHNSVYWSGKPYLGLGPSAHSYFPPKRFANVSDLDLYLNDLNGDKLTHIMTEELSGQEKQLEQLYLALRTSAGINLAKNSVDELIAFDLASSGYGLLEKGRFVLTDRGFLVLDEIIQRFIQSRDSIERVASQV